MKLSEIIGQTSPVDMKPSVEIGSTEALVERQRENGVLPESGKRDGTPGRGAGYWLTESQKRENRRSAEEFESMVARFKAQSAKPAQAGEKVSEPEQNAPKAEQPQENPPEIEAKAEQQPEPAPAPEYEFPVEVTPVVNCYEAGPVCVTYNSATDEVEIELNDSFGRIQYTADPGRCANELGLMAKALKAIAAVIRGEAGE